MIVRLILFVILFLLFMWLYKHIKALIAQKNQQSHHSANTDTSAEVMIKCTHCQLYTPKSQSIENKRHEFFCCKEHQIAHDQTTHS